MLRAKRQDLRKASSFWFRPSILLQELVWPTFYLCQLIVVRDTIRHDRLIVKHRPEKHFATTRKIQTLPYKFQATLKVIPLLPRCCCFFSCFMVGGLSEEGSERACLHRCQFSASFFLGVLFKGALMGCFLFLHRAVLLLLIGLIVWHLIGTDWSWHNDLRDLPGTKMFFFFVVLLVRLPFFFRNFCCLMNHHIA